RDLERDRLVAHPEQLDLVGRVDERRLHVARDLLPVVDRRDDREERDQEVQSPTLTGCMWRYRAMLRLPSMALKTRSICCGVWPVAAATSAAVMLLFFAYKQRSIWSYGSEK